MLILRGKAGKYALPGEQPRDWPKGALDEPAALDFARLRGYDAAVMDVVGYSGANGPQVRKTLAAIRADDEVLALYGFSAGGYAIYHIIRALTAREAVEQPNPRLHERGPVEPEALDVERPLRRHALQPAVREPPQVLRHVRAERVEQRHVWRVGLVPVL